MPPAGGRVKGGILFRKREYPLWNPKRKAFIASEQLEELQCLPIALPARGVAAFGVAIRFAAASIIRCRSAHLVGVRSNFRLPPVPSMRRAQQCRYFARSLPPRKRHSRLTTVRRGCCQITTRRDSWRSHVHRTHTAQRVQSFKLQTRNGGVKGRRPLRSLGGPRGPFSHVREWPPYSVQRHRRCLSLPRRARETPSPVGQIKKVQLFLKNPLDKWAPRAIMQPTSEELQTYDGEK